MSAGKLTPKQARFVQEYLVDLNATQAAIRSGYSAKTAKSIGQENLTKPDIVSAIETAQNKRAESVGITAERVLRELALIGFSNMLDYIQPSEDGGAFVDLSALTREQAAAIGEVTVDTYQERKPDGKDGETRTVKKIKFKLADKRAALVDVGRHLGMFKDKVEMTGAAGGPMVFAWQTNPA